MIFSPAVDKLYRDSLELAYVNNHQYCSLDHIAYLLLQIPPMQNMFNQLGTVAGSKIQVSQVFDKVYKYIMANTPKAQSPSDLPDSPLKMKMSAAAKMFIEAASGRAEQKKRSAIDLEDLLVALYQLPPEVCFTRRTLEEDMGITKRILVMAITPPREEDEDVPPSQEAQPGAEDAEAEAFNKAIKGALVNLTNKAKDGKIQEVIGREVEIERVFQSLLRSKKSNAILVGEPGVGKTSIAEGLALKIVKNEVPDRLKNFEIYALDLAALMSGTKFRGDFEGRMQAVLKIVSKNPRIILFIDEIHTLVGAGATSGGAMDASNMLKPMLASGEIKVLGATTYKEYKVNFEKDAALNRRFTKIDVSEPTAAETEKILFRLRSKLEEHHGVSYTDGAIKTVVELTGKYMNDRFFPDKAIDALDEAGSWVHLNKTPDQKVTKSVVEKVIAKMARLPDTTVTTSSRERLQNMERDLKLLIYGQDQAIEDVSNSIQINSAGIGNENKPIGSFLFAGPTGVGKTELARQLATNLGMKLEKFDMSEYMEKHQVARLIGAPAGYVGYEDGGLLTDAISKNPSSVILFDEVEKAHPDTMNLFLQILSDGVLTDSNGRKTNFKNTVIIFTTNAGASEMSSKNVIGISPEKAMSLRPTKAIENGFTPEFRNRLDGIVYFNSLNEEHIMRVLNKNMAALESQLALKKITLEVSGEAKTFLANEGFDPAMGARPMDRVLQDRIRKPLSREINFGKLEKGGIAKVDLKDGSLTYEFTSKGADKKTPLPATSEEGSNE